MNGVMMEFWMKGIMTRVMLDGMKTVNSCAKPL